MTKGAYEWGTFIDNLYTANAHGKRDKNGTLLHNDTERIQKILNGTYVSNQFTNEDNETPMRTFPDELMQEGLARLNTENQSSSNSDPWSTLYEDNDDEPGLSEVPQFTIQKIEHRIINEPEN